MSEDNIYKFSGDDEGMLQASEAARRTFKFFWRELSWENRRIVPGLDLAAVKLPFKNDDQQDGEPEYEHMWVGDVEFDGEVVRGTLLNDAQWIDSLEAGMPAESPLEEIGDWMYGIHGKVYGAYTVNYMRGTMPRQERAAHDDAWGLGFGDPEDIQLVPAEKPSGSFLKRLFGSAPEAPPLATLERIEHPMSVNMAPKIEDALAGNPSSAKDVDDDGWTMLHRDSLAGNLTPVRILVSHGADIHLKTPSGYSAIDLARKMGWPHVVEHLENC